MKTFLLPEGGKFYKANLHMHSTVSDGEMTPEQVKKEYMEKGYSVVAFSDHEVPVAHPELIDENFVAITAVEWACSDNKPFRFSKNLHLNMFAKDINNVALPVFGMDSILYPQSIPYIDPETRKFNFKRKLTPECINEVIRLCNEAGFLVTLNHPVWSMLDHEDYIDYKGLWGVEVYTTGGAMGGYPDTAVPYDDLLKKGEKVFPSCTDDAHFRHEAFGAWNMIKAEKLTYESIIDAMIKGNFYATTGPEIKELYIEREKFHIKTSPAAKIFMRSNHYFTGYRASDDLLTEATFDFGEFYRAGKALKDGEVLYVRFEVIDEHGNIARTRAFFSDELVTE